MKNLTQPINSPARVEESIARGADSLLAVRAVIGKQAFAYAVEYVFRTQDTGDGNCCVCTAYRKAADAARDVAYEEGL